MASPVRGCYKVQARDAGVVGWVTAVQREEQGLQEVLGDTLAGPRGWLDARGHRSGKGWGGNRRSRCHWLRQEGPGLAGEGNHTGEIVNLVMDGHVDHRALWKQPSRVSTWAPGHVSGAQKSGGGRWDLAWAHQPLCPCSCQGLPATKSHLFLLLHPGLWGLLQLSKQNPGGAPPSQASYSHPSLTLCSQFSQPLVISPSAPAALITWTTAGKLASLYPPSIVTIHLCPWYMDQCPHGMGRR